MENIIAQIQLIKEKALALKQQNKELIQDNEQLKRSLNRLKQLIEVQNNTIKEQEDKLKIRKIADGSSDTENELGSNEKRVLKMKINEMINEIDKVISSIAS